jgi:hypothetical protein
MRKLPFDAVIVNLVGFEHEIEIIQCGLVDYAGKDELDQNDDRFPMAKEYEMKSRTQLAYLKLDPVTATATAVQLRKVFKKRLYRLSF